MVSVDHESAKGFQGSLLHHDLEISLFQLSYVIPLAAFPLGFLVSVDYEASWQACSNMDRPCVRNL